MGAETPNTSRQSTVAPEAFTTSAHLGIFDFDVGAKLLGLLFTTATRKSVSALRVPASLSVAHRLVQLRGNIFGKVRRRDERVPCRGVKSRIAARRHHWHVRQRGHPLQRGDVLNRIPKHATTILAPSLGAARRRCGSCRWRDPKLPRSPAVERDRRADFPRSPWAALMHEAFNARISTNAAHAGDVGQADVRVPAFCHGQTHGGPCPGTLRTRSRE